MRTKIIMKALLFFIGPLTMGYANSDDLQNTLDIIFQHAKNAIAYAEDDKVFLYGAPLGSVNFGGEILCPSSIAKGEVNLGKFARLKLGAGAKKMPMKIH